MTLPANWWGGALAAVHGKKLPNWHTTYHHMLAQIAAQAAANGGSVRLARYRPGPGLYGGARILRVQDDGSGCYDDSGNPVSCGGGSTCYDEYGNQVDCSVDIDSGDGSDDGSEDWSPDGWVGRFGSGLLIVAGTIGVLACVTTVCAVGAGAAAVIGMGLYLANCVY
jgi:hypothetical protein